MSADLKNQTGTVVWTGWKILNAARANSERRRRGNDFRPRGTVCRDRDSAQPPILVDIRSIDFAHSRINHAPVCGQLAAGAW